MTFMPTTGQTPGPPVSGSGTPGPLRMTPGRWAALAIGVPVALALIGWTGFSLIGTVAKGSYPFSYPVPVRNGQVALNLNFGNVTVHQTSGSTASLTGVVQYGLFRPGISENITPGDAFVSVNCDGLNSNCNANATLDVPAKTAVTMSSGGGDIGVSGIAGNMALSAEGGNVTADNLAGDLRLDTGGGDLTGNGLTGTIQITAEGGNINASNLSTTGTMRLDTGGGDLTGNAFTGNFLLFTEGGNVNAAAVDSHQVAIQSGGGDVTVVFTQPPKNLQITAEGGNVTVVLPQDHTQYDISTPDTQGGTVSYPQTLASSSSHRLITVDSGGGDVTIAQGLGKM
jgi:Putative adhesin